MSGGDVEPRATLCESFCRRRGSAAQSATHSALERAKDLQMQRVDGTLIFSPSDLQKFVDCEHLTRLQVRVCDGDLVAPSRDDQELDLLRRKGMEHERAWLERLRSEGKSIVEISERNDWTIAA